MKKKNHKDDPLSSGGMKLRPASKAEKKKKAKGKGKKGKRK